MISEVDLKIKIGRLIKVKNSVLRNLRNNLRKVFLTSVEQKYDKTIDMGETQISFNNWCGVQKINHKIDLLYRLLYESICSCNDCRSTEEDAVYWDNSIYDQFYYPPLKENEKKFSIVWVCPKCYKERIKKIEQYKKEKYYYFREYSTFDTLESLGIESLDDLDKLKNM